MICYQRSALFRHIMCLLAIFILFSVLPPARADTEIGSHRTTITERISTRSGPGPAYDGTGSYFDGNHSCVALSKSYDRTNDIWWIQIEFKYGKSYRRVYTGVKHLSMNSGAVPEETVLGSAVTETPAQAKYGPGEGYANKKYIVPAGTEGYVYIHENGHVLFEFDDEEGQLRRAWIEESCLEGGAWTGEDLWTNIYRKRP